jgi:glycerol-3-phosphate acyltransferase PlsY
MIVRLTVILIGYLVGSIIQAGYWMGRINHIDIRQYGSGNAGTTNVMRTLGKKAGFITYFLDAFKPALSCLIVHFIFGKSCDYEMLLFIYSGLGVILGHNFPFYMGFKGGKGIAATSGVVLTLAVFPEKCWIILLVCMAAFFIVLFISKYVSLGSLIGISLVFILYCVWAALGLLPLTGTHLAEALIVLFIITALGFIRHSANIKRLANGTERKIGQKKTEVQNG